VAKSSSSPFAEALELHFALLVDYCVALGDSQDLLSPTLIGLANLRIIAS